MHPLSSVRNFPDVLLFYLIITFPLHTYDVSLNIGKQMLHKITLWVKIEVDVFTVIKSW